MRSVHVVGIQLEMPTNRPVLMLRDPMSDKFLPLWIGTAEATAISLALDGVEPDRPLTHDLLANTITELGHELLSVSIVSLIDDVFYAQLNLENGVDISARPSDAVALAIRIGVPIYVADEVIDEAGVDIEETSEPADENDDLAEFRAFLDEVNPEDFS